MTQPRLTRAALILAIVALAIFIAERLWQLGAALGDIVSIIAVSWLLALLVKPMITQLRGGLVPSPVVRWASRRYGDGIARRLAAARLPFGVAVGLVYILLLVVLIGGLSFATASIVPQALDLVRQLPEISTDLPLRATVWYRETAPRVGLNPDAFDITQFVSPQDLSARAAELAGALAGSAVNFAATAAGALGQVFLVLVLSLYVVAEDRLIARQLFAVMPSAWHDTARAISSGIDRAFNGYLRAQAISALLHGLAALIVFALFGVNFGVIVALLFAALSVVPLIGIPIATLIAAIVTLISAPGTVIPVVVILLVFDQIVAYGVVPKLMTDSTGVPSLVAMIALIIGVQLLGFWGLVFSVPLVGAVYAIVFDVILPRRRKAQGLPPIDPVMAELSRKTPPSIKLPSLPGSRSSAEQKAES
jgi:predicted PurR-regulated permease PerM